jgi:histidinol-phosphate aminotransferase
VNPAESRFDALAQAGIQGLRAYDPGHDLIALRRRFGEAALIELGGNENPYGPSPAARAAALDALNALHRYPDPLGGDLKRALAAHHGVDIAQILLGNGSHELLMQFSQAFAGPGVDVVASRYGFAVYALATQAAGATLRVAEAHPPAHPMPRGHDLDAIAAAVTPATRLVYLANPNNPTGTWFASAALDQLLHALPRDVLVVVDEAYAEYVIDPELPSAVALLPRHPNLIVTRTFSKAYGLAGLRVGYALAHPELIAVMERLRESFNVNSVGLAAATTALTDQRHVDWARDRNAVEREALAGSLRERGHFVHPSQTNFLLVEFGANTAAIEAALVARGAVLRPMAGYGLPDCLRITVGTGDENRRLLGLLDEIAAAGIEPSGIEPDGIEPDGIDA